MTFLLRPAIDLWASGLFYSPELGFHWKAIAPVVWSYEVVDKFEAVVLWTLLVLLLLCFVIPPLLRLASFSHLAARLGMDPTRLRNALKFLKPRLGYLLLVLALGPGLMVNEVFKNQFGRARPEKVEAFGGASRFTPPFVPAKECEKNCSFVSGHASLGFYILSFGYVDTRRRRRWLAAGIVLGGIAGLSRVIQGAHFLSDVIFAFFAVFLTAVVVFHVFRRLGWLPPLPSDPGPASKDGTAETAQAHAGNR